MVVACVALALSLSGVGYAATVLPRNSVGATQLRDNAVVSKKVQNGSLLAADFRAGELPAGAQGPAGPKGDKGDRGDKGDKGSAGAPGLSGYQVVRVQGPFTHDVFVTARASCPAGKKLIAGGAGIGVISDNSQFLVESEPSADGTAWVAAATNPKALGTVVNATAVCANVS